MALNEQLNKFKKQQEKCQSTLSSIASSRAVPLRPSVPAAAISQTNRPATNYVKFSDDTKRLQEIYFIRKAPVGAQIKRVIDLLSQTRKAFTPEQIKEACYVDINANKDVFGSLKVNPKVHYDGERFSYKATHNVTNKRQLLSLVKKYPDGISVNDLKDAYLKVLEDLQALKASGDIWLLSNTNSKEDIAYPNDFKTEIQVDDEFKALFRDIAIPNDMLDVEKELRKIGLKPVMNTAARRAAAAKIHGVSNNKPNQKKKKKNISKRTKLTNFHLPELFPELK